MSAIKEVLSRKMFSQGGLLGPEKPKEPTGILASSEPLMKAAKFANGGSANDLMLDRTTFALPDSSGDALIYQDVDPMQRIFPAQVTKPTFDPSLVGLAKQNK